MASMADGRGRDRLSLILVCVLVAVAFVDAPLLLLSVGFGPEGFGGDANPSPSYVAAYHRGQAAGVVALLIAVIGVAAYFLAKTPTARRAVLSVALAAQLIAFSWFWVAAG